MRKYGFGFMIFGGALGVLLFLVRCGDWYREAQMNSMSEPAQLVESAFWACLITLLIGLLLFLLSLRKKPQTVPADDGYDAVDEAPYQEPYEEPYVEPYADPYELPYEPAEPIPQSAPRPRPFDFEAPYTEPSVKPKPVRYSPPLAPDASDKKAPASSAAAAQPYFSQPVDFSMPAPKRQSESSLEPTLRISDMPKNKMQHAEWECAICGCTNPDFSAACAVCGAARGSTL